MEIITFTHTHTHNLSLKHKKNGHTAILVCTHQYTQMNGPTTILAIFVHARMGHWYVLLSYTHTHTKIPTHTFTHNLSLKYKKNGPRAILAVTKVTQMENGPFLLLHLDTHTHTHAHRVSQI